MKDTFFFVAGLLFLALAKAKNLIMGYTTPRTFDTSDAERCIDYDISVVDGWLHGLGEYSDSDGLDAIQGMRILELGSGSDLGVGLYLLAKGAKSYAACDVNDLALKAPDALYAPLWDRLQSDETSLGLRTELALTRAKTPSRLVYVVRKDFDLVAAFGLDAVDIVFSQAAFEHFDDIHDTFQRLASVCAPGARLVAEIDLKTHSRWIRDKDPNNIYRYPQWLYRFFWFRGAPNRVRPVQYARALEQCGWTNVVVSPGTALGAAHMSRISRRFRDDSLQMSLLTILVCATLPGVPMPTVDGIR